MLVCYWCGCATAVDTSLSGMAVIRRSYFAVFRCACSQLIYHGLCCGFVACAGFLLYSRSGVILRGDLLMGHHFFLAASICRQYVSIGADLESRVM